MAHGIFNEMFTERNVRKSAWHGLGTAFDPNRSVKVSDLTVEIGADYQVSKRPVVVDFNGYQIETGKFSIAHGGIQGGNPQHLDFCTARWEPVQNIDIARAFDKLSATWPVETMGVLWEGAGFFFTLKGENWSIPVNGTEDAHSEYLFVSNRHKSDESIQIGSGSTRVVCQNTLNAAISGARFHLPLSHNTGANDLVELVSKYLTQIVSTRNALRAAYAQMAKQTISLAQAQTVFEQAWPEPARPKLIRTLDTLTADATDAGVIDTVKAAIEAAERVEDRRATAEVAWVNACQRRQTYIDAAYTSLGEMEAEGLGVNMYTAVQAVGEVQQHRLGAKGDTAADLLFGGGRHNIQAAVDYALTGKLRKGNLN